MKDVPTALTVCYPKQLITSHGKEASSPGAHGLEQQSTSKILNQGTFSTLQLPDTNVYS